MLGGSKGSERLGDLYTLDVDTWLWNCVQHPSIFPISQTLTCTYPSIAYSDLYDSPSETDLAKMSVEQIQRFLRYVIFRNP